VPVSSTARPGKNFKVAGFGVASVWMNMGSSGSWHGLLPRAVTRFNSL
jgi:hypothetical protein